MQNLKTRLARLEAADIQRGPVRRVFRQIIDPLHPERNVIPSDIGEAGPNDIIITREIVYPQTSAGTA